MANKLVNRILVTSLLCATSCATYRPMESDKKESDIVQEAAKHHLYDIVPRYSEQIKTFDVGHWIAWSLLGNEDDGIFGEDRRRPYSTNITTKTFLSWSARNPLHNFTFYTIGSADWDKHYNFDLVKINDENTSLFTQGKDNVPKGFALSVNDYKPFVSLQFPWSEKRRFSFYFGWRPEGCFGIKFRPFSKNKRAKK